MNHIENKLNQIYRCHDILDEKVLNVIKKVNRELFVPKDFRSFSSTDYSIPLENGQNMLTPSDEAKIIQEMNFDSKDSVLVVGMGSGYLTECISHLCQSITSYEIDDDLFKFGKNNLDLHSRNRHKIDIKNKNITADLKEIEHYTKTVFTCSLNSYQAYVRHLGTNSRSFFFINQHNSPYKEGIIIEKTRNGYTEKKNIVTSKTNQLMD